YNEAHLDYPILAICLYLEMQRDHIIMSLLPYYASLKILWFPLHSAFANNDEYALHSPDPRPKSVHLKRQVSVDESMLLLIEHAVSSLLITLLRFSSFPLLNLLHVRWYPFALVERCTTGKITLNYHRLLDVHTVHCDQIIYRSVI